LTPAAAAMAERRRDPVDGAAYTYEELAAFYRGGFTRAQILRYWESECIPARAAKAKAKQGKAKAKAKAEGRKAPARTPASQEEVVKRVSACKVIPVIKIDDVAHAVPLCRALKDGGIDVAEITFRTSCGPEAIREVCRDVEGVCVGAGTVLTPQQVDIAVDNGADFVVSPGFDQRVGERCRARKVLYLPGVVTPSEVMAASSRLRLTTLKFFPASNFGGAGTLKSYAAVFPGLSFMPTGGVSEANIADYVSLPNVIAAGGSWMVADALVKQAAETGDWSDVVAGARKASQAANAGAAK